MIKKSIKIIIFILIISIAFFLRKKDYAQIPIAGQSVDEYSYSWVGLSLLKTGMPIGISGIPGYQHQYSKYINVDRLYQTLSSEALNINYPWMDHPPLLGLITGGYAYLSGARVFEDTTALLIRRPIILIGTVSVALLMIFTWINFGYLNSIISGAIYATTPLVVLGSRMIQAENAIIPCLLLVMICLGLYFSKKKDYWLIFAAIFSGIATLFKLTGVVCYLFVFLSLLYHYKKFNQQFSKDFFFFLLISLPISLLFVVYGLSYGFNNFINIFFSNTNRFYGIGPNALIDLIKNQRLTQHKFLPEIWIITGWFSFMFLSLKKKISDKSFLVFISITSYLIVYLFFGSQPYGWYTFPFWPLLILSLSIFLSESIKENKNILLTFILSIILLGSNISRVVGIFEFQPFANWWRLGVSGIFMFLVVSLILKKPSNLLIRIIIISILIIALYFNFRYLQLINIDSWWQNIS